MAEKYPVMVKFDRKQLANSSKTLANDRDNLKKSNFNSFARARPGKKLARVKRRVRGLNDIPDLSFYCYFIRSSRSEPPILCVAGFRHGFELRHEGILCWRIVLS